MNLRTVSLSAALLLVTLLPAACHENPVDPNAAYITAINSYWRVHPRCLWTQPVKMPAQELAEKSGRTVGYDALTDLGYLQRSQAEKKTFIFGDKPVNVYDLTDKGKTAWVPVVRSPGYGNFCYGHRKVLTVDSVKVTSDIGANPGIAAVNYHYEFPDMAPWAKDPELQTAFPAVAAAFANPLSDTATLTKTSSGWVMNTPAVAAPTAAPPPVETPATNPPSADYGVVGSPAPATAQPAADPADAETPAHHRRHHRR